MSDNNWMGVLEANKLMRSRQEVIAFETALAELAQHPNAKDLPSLHLIFDDRCEQPEVMFSLLHFIESFDLQQQLQSFITVVPTLIGLAQDWTRIIHTRILNDDSACQLYRKLLHSANSQNPHFIRQLLEESATGHLTELN
ncbi:MAG: Imm30 family immunity protein [Coleofasciculus sp. C2-GNP5-27]